PVVPGPGDDDAHGLPLPRPHLLPPARPHAHRALVRERMAERHRARPDPRPAAQRHLPGRRRGRGLRLPRPPRAPLTGPRRPRPSAGDLGPTRTAGGWTRLEPTTPPRREAVAARGSERS